MKKTMMKNMMKINMMKIFSLIAKHFTWVNIIVGLFVLILVGLIKYSGIVLFLLNFIALDNTEYAEYFITGTIGLAARLGIKGIVEESCSNHMTMGGSSNLMTMGGPDGTISSAGGASSSGTISTTGGSSGITNTGDDTFSRREHKFSKKFVSLPSFRQEIIQLLKSKVTGADQVKLNFIEMRDREISRYLEQIEKIKNNTEMDSNEATTQIKNLKRGMKRYQRSIQENINSLIKSYPEIVPSEKDKDVQSITNQLSNLTMHKRNLSEQSDEVSRRIKPKK